MFDIGDVHMLGCHAWLVISCLSCLIDELSLVTLRARLQRWSRVWGRYNFNIIFCVYDM